MLTLTITISVLLLLALGGVVTMIFAARSASEGFEDEVGFHHVRMARTPVAQESEERQ